MPTRSTENPVLLCLHGYAANRHTWLGLQSELDTHRQLLLPDLPGHGANWQQEPAHCLYSLAEQLWHTIDEGSVDILGHSLGGALAIHMAAIAPARVRTLTLLAPLGLGCGINTSQLETLLRLDDQDTALRWLQSLVHTPKLIPPTLAGMLLQHLRQAGVRDRLGVLAQQMIHDEQMPSSLDAVIEHQVPRLIVWGSNDTLNPHRAADSHSFAGQWNILEYCGHLAHIEKRTKLCALLVNHLNLQAV